jgi:hypothetical protein
MPTKKTVKVKSYQRCICGRYVEGVERERGTCWFCEYGIDDRDAEWREGDTRPTAQVLAELATDPLFNDIDLTDQVVS